MAALARRRVVAAPGGARRPRRPREHGRAPDAATPDQREATRSSWPTRRSRTGSTRYPNEGPARPTRPTRSAQLWTVKVWSGRPARSRPGRVDDTTGASPRRGPGPQVAWKMARGYRRRVRRQGDQQLAGLARLLRSCSCSAWPTWRRPLCAPQPRPARAALVLGLALVLQPGRHLHERAARLSAARLPARRAASGSARRGPRPPARPLWPVWVLAAATVFLAGFRIGLNVQPSNVIDVGYSGVIGAERIANGQAPYGHFPVEDDLKACGPADARRRDPRPHPDERPLRVREPAAATPTGRSPTWPTCPATWRFGWSGQVGRPPRGPLRVDRSSTCSACSAWRSSAGASAATGSP